MGDGQRPRHLRRLSAAAALLLLVAGVAAAIAIRDDSTVSFGARPTVETTAVGASEVQPSPATVPDPAPDTVTTVAASVTTARPASRSPARIQVKFVDWSGVRLRAGALVSVSGQDMAALQKILAGYPGTTVDRLFQRPEAELAAEKAAAEARTGRPQPDLNLYYRLTIAEGARADALVADLKRLPMVEQAYPDPVAAPPPAPAP